MFEHTLMLDRASLSTLLGLDACIDAVEAAFRAHGEGTAPAPGLLHADTERGEFHIKAGVLHLGHPYFAVKINGGFFSNRQRFQMPNIQGLILLCDGDNGYPLALMDSKEITVKRTGAATAVAARYLARPESSVLTLCGCGVQGMIQLEAMKRCFALRKVFAYSRTAEAREKFAAEASTKFGIQVEATSDLQQALSQSDLCITCTPSKQAFVRREWIRPGTFVAAVGADSPEKQELDPSLLPGNRVVADILDQCVAVGEIHHAIEAGLMGAGDVHAELGEIAAGRKCGRNSADEITIFDSTGTALQDVAAAVLVYHSVREQKRPGFNFFAS